jgi:hypothetical protein
LVFGVSVKEGQDVEVFLLEVDVLLVKAVSDYLLLFLDWLGPPVNFLECALNKVSLALGKHLHFLEC